MIRTFGPHAPRVHRTAFVHDSAELIGKVELKARASIWPLCVLRGDIDRIVIGARSNIQDLTVIHTRPGKPALVGEGVTVGHRAVLHGCRIGDGCLIGMGALVMEAVIGDDCLVAAGSLVPAGMRVAPGSLVLGAPARVRRALTAAERRSIRAGARAYLIKAAEHRTRSRIVFP